MFWIFHFLPFYLFRCQTIDRISTDGTNMPEPKHLNQECQRDSPAKSWTR
jgi:hypothetical protein